MPTKQGHKSVQDGDLPLVREAADEQGADVRETYTTSFPFLQLPTELRLRVYREVLVQSRPIELWPHVPNNTIGMANLQRATTMRLYRENIQPRLQLLRTNKLIHAEASEMFYGENEWRFSGINAWMVFSCWLHTIGQPHFKWLKHVVLHVPFEGKDFVAYPTYVTSNWRERICTPDSPPSECSTGEILRLQKQLLQFRNRLYRFGFNVPSRLSYD